MKRKIGEWTRGLAAAGIAAALCMTATGTINAQQEKEQGGQGSGSASAGAEEGKQWKQAIGELKKGLSKKEWSEHAHKCKGEKNIPKCPGSDLRKPEKPPEMPKPPKKLKPGKIKEALKDALKNDKGSGKGGGGSGEDCASKGAYGQLKKGGAADGGEIPEIEKAGPVELPPGAIDQGLRKGASGASTGVIEGGEDAPAPENE